MKRSIPSVFGKMSNNTSCTKFIDPVNGVFTGAVAVVDYCCHPHKDYNNMVGGATAVISFNGDKVGFVDLNPMFLSSGYVEGRNGER